MEKLYELHEDGGYDVVVLDTPPTRNALDFLDAPDRLLRFVDSPSLRLLTAPGRLGLKVFGRGTGAALAILERVAGVDLLRDVTGFMRSFDSMADDFGARAARVKQLLADPGTTFFAVTSAGPEAVSETASLARRLPDWGMGTAAAVVNRVHEAVPADPELERALTGLLEHELAAKVSACLEDGRALAANDRAGIERLGRELPGTPLIVVPQLEGDVQDLPTLARVSEHLFGG